MGAGAFSSMGGMQVSANDYAKWIAFLLSAWPSRDDADTGPVKRASVRELARGQSLMTTRTRPGRVSGQPCAQAANYSMGMQVAVDCEFGLSLSHGGGYPGYGSHMLIFPERGVGLFVFTNRTYAGSPVPLWDAAVMLNKAERLGKPASSKGSAFLTAAYNVVGNIYKAGNVRVANDSLAMNFLMDKSVENWTADLSRFKAAAGDCDTSSDVDPSGALSGNFSWRCTHGRIRGNFILSPDTPPRIQSLRLTVAAP
jgi:serine-type D-Ala-D-Ala carboxypeptidase/endopeptidase